MDHIYSRIIAQYHQEIDLLVRYGKLTKEDGWWNVVEHSLSEVLVGDIISDYLEINTERKDMLLRAILCHDWDKRLEVRPQDFNQEEIKNALDYLNRISINLTIIRVTKPEFLDEMFEYKNTSFLQKLMYFIDISTDGTKFIDFNERIRNAMSRNPGLKQLKME